MIIPLCIHNRLVTQEWSILRTVCHSEVPAHIHTSVGLGYISCGRSTGQWDNHGVSGDLDLREPALPPAPLFGEVKMSLEADNLSLIRLNLSFLIPSSRPTILNRATIPSRTRSTLASVASTIAWHGWVFLLRKKKNLVERTRLRMTLR